MTSDSMSVGLELAVPRDLGVGARLAPRSPRTRASSRRPELFPSGSPESSPQAARTTPRVSARTGNRTRRITERHFRCGAGQVRPLTLSRPAKGNLRGARLVRRACHMPSISRCTRSSCARNGSLQSTVRCAWSLSLRCTQSTVKSRRRSWALRMNSPAEPGPRGLRRHGLGLEDLQVGRDPGDRAALLEQVVEARGRGGCRGRRGRAARSAGGPAAARAWRGSARSAST